MAKKPKPASNTTKQAGAGNGLGGAYAAGSPIAVPPAVAGNIPQPGSAYVAPEDTPPEGSPDATPGAPTPVPGPAGDEPGYKKPGDPGYTPPTGNNDASPPEPEIDWAQVYFGQYNLPADLVAQIEGLGKRYGASNPSVFFQSALNLVRGSDWFKTTYPGFAAGVTAGLFTDETGYRAYLNQVNQLYRQYAGRDVNSAETASLLGQGLAPGQIANQFQGDAIAKTNAPEWQYLTGAFDDTGQLSDAESQAAGREQAGLDTPLGQLVQKRLAVAAQRAQKIFSGTLATPSLSLGGQGLYAPSLQGGKATPDVGA